MSEDFWPGLLAFDQAHVWHPYSPMPARQAAVPIVGAKGAHLRTADGRSLIDGMASWWSVIHGHGAPEIVAAITAQAERMPHVMFGGLTHQGAIELAQALVDLAPPGIDRVFFSDSGSVAVEVALKLCVQYWNGKGQPHRTRMLSVRGGYHGDTFGAMSVCDPELGMHRMYTGILPKQVFAPRPPDGFEAPLDDAWAAGVEAALADADGTIAGVILEPIVQGAGGMRFHSPACLRFLRGLCDRHDLLLVLDEIATGFGRTGEMLACRHASVAPDVLCVGKALTGGTVTLAATLTTGAVSEAVGASEPGALMHGPTFMANPIACAAALASLSLLEDGTWQADVMRVEGALRTGLALARELAGVRDVRVLGAIGVIEMEEPVDLAAATAVAMEHGVWLRPFGKLVYTMPPYIVTDGQIEKIIEAMLCAASAGRRR
jgi:adenosylmethionine---8-amino-7-oxononanoate aminotransferase